MCNAYFWREARKLDFSRYRNIAAEARVSWCKKWSGREEQHIYKDRKADNLTAICEPIV
jgi:hypothetical protein